MIPLVIVLRHTHIECFSVRSLLAFDVRTLGLLCNPTSSLISSSSFSKYNTFIFKSVTSFTALTLQAHFLLDFLSCAEMEKYSYTTVSFWALVGSIELCSINRKSIQKSRGALVHYWYKPHLQHPFPLTHDCNGDSWNCHSLIFGQLDKWIELCSFATVIEKVIKIQEWVGY